MRLWSISLAFLALGGCAYEVEFDPAFVSAEVPSYTAEAEIVVLMHDHDLELVYEGSPDSAVGESTTLTIPIGAVMREISARVFQSCFTYGVVFTEQLLPGMQYLLAIEPEIRDFSYQYDRRVEQGLVEVRPTRDGQEVEEVPVSTITPQVQFELGLRAYGPGGSVVLEKTYPSGLVSGESYIVTYRPHERINATFHSALQDIMLAVAEDIRPLLVGQCEMTDLDGNPIAGL